MDEPLIKFEKGTISQHELQAKVADYWIKDVGWRWEKVEGLLEEHAVCKMRSFMLVEDDTCIDTASWSHEPSGSFSITSAYNIIHSDAGVDEDKAWSDIWKLPIPNKMRVFLWLAYHKRIMSNELRRKKGFTTVDRCYHCPTTTEDADHILRRCKLAEDVWRRVAPKEVTHTNWQKPFDEWLRGNVKAPSIHGPDWTTKFAIVVWWLWRWRNDAVFNDMHYSEMQKAHWIKKQIEEVNRAFLNALKPGGKSLGGATRWLRWVKPTQGWVVINTDGSVNLRDKNAGCGGVIRDDKGDWIIGFSMSIGCCSVEEAEAWAVYKGLILARDKRKERIIVRSDSSFIINILNRSHAESYQCTKVTNVLDNCRRIIGNFSEVKFVHVFREQNKVADALARKAKSSGKGMRAFDRPPDWILPLLIDDMMDVPSVRGATQEGS